MKWKKIGRNNQNENAWHPLAPQDGADVPKQLSQKEIEEDDSNGQSVEEDQKMKEGEMRKHGSEHRGAKTELNSLMTLHGTMDDQTLTINQLRLELSEEMRLSNEHLRKINKLSQQVEDVESKCERLKVDNKLLKENEKHAVRLKIYYRRLVTNHIAFRDVIHPSDEELLKEKLNTNSAVLSSLSQEMPNNHEGHKSKSCISTPPRSKSYVCSSVNYETKHLKQTDQPPLSRSNIDTTHQNETAIPDSPTIKSNEKSSPLQNDDVTNTPVTEVINTFSKESFEVDPPVDSASIRIGGILSEKVRNGMKKLDDLIDDVGNIECPF